LHRTVDLYVFVLYNNVSFKRSRLITFKFTWRIWHWLRNACTPCFTKHYENILQQLMILMSFCSKFIETHVRQYNLIQERWTNCKKNKTVKFFLPQRVVL